MSAMRNSYGKFEKQIHYFETQICYMVSVGDDILLIIVAEFTTKLINYFLFQKCYEQKQYKNGLKFSKQILSNPKFCEHGGEYSAF